MIRLWRNDVTSPVSFVDRSVSCLFQHMETAICRLRTTLTTLALHGYACEMRVLTPPSMSQLVAAITFCGIKLSPPEMLVSWAIKKIRYWSDYSRSGKGMGVSISYEELCTPIMWLQVFQHGFTHYKIRKMALQNDPPCSKLCMQQSVSGHYKMHFHVFNLMWNHGFWLFCDRR